MKSIINKEEEKKLTIQHLSAYLPYGLKIKGYQTDEETIEVIGELYQIETGKTVKQEFPIQPTIIVGDYELYLGDDEIFPILRPLSDLTKEIEVNGERFVPAGKMITHGFHNTFWYELDKFNYQYLYAMDYEKLLSWHFDIFGLIDQNLAIDLTPFNHEHSRL